MIVISKNDLPKEKVEQVHALVTTPAGTIPGDRAYGIDQSIQDLPIEIYKVKYVSEISVKVKKYIPGIQVKEVLFELDPKDGRVLPKVVIDWN